MDFDNYLTTKLKELNVDETVFKPYIVGILGGDEDMDEKKIGISEILELDNDDAVLEIIEKWNSSHVTNNKTETKNKMIDMDEQLTKLLEKQKIQATVQKQYTEEELKIREQILANYSQTMIREDEDEDIGATQEKATDDDDLVRNTNKADVAAAVRAKREQAKLESQKKKDKDKEDLKKQKQLKEEKKEKRKTVKSEKRR